FERLRSPSHEFFEMDWLEYLLGHHHGQIGLYLYDADHTYDAQLRALQCGLPHIAPGGFVVVGGTNYDDVLPPHTGFLAENAGAFDVLLDVRTANNCHPTYWNGITVWRRSGGAAA